jgi:hypothetical protein
MTERKIVTAEAVKLAKAAMKDSFEEGAIDDACIRSMLEAAGREIASKAVTDFAEDFLRVAEMINVPKSIYLHVTAIAKRYALDVREGKRLR